MRQVLGLVWGLGLFSTVAQAQVPDATLHFSNAGVTLSLAEGSPVTIDNEGSVRILCAIKGGYCEGLAGSGQGGAPPTTQVFRLDVTPRLIPGSHVRLGWSSQQAAVCVQSQQGPASTTWTGPRKPQWLSGQYVVLPAMGTYTLGIRCFNPNGVSSVAQVSVTVVAALPQDPTPVPPPTIDPNDPTQPDVPVTPPGQTYSCNRSGIAPAGLTGTTLTWVDAWSAYNNSILATFPNSIGYPTPVGSARAGYTVVPFFMPANTTLRVDWDQVQTGQPLTGYTRPRPAQGMSFIVSPCPGDLRPSTEPAPANDLFLGLGCRKGTSAGSMTLSSRPEAVGVFGVCHLPANHTYYMTIAARALGTYAPGAHSCADTPNSQQGCDVNARHYAVE